jgi:hypothetical protein
MDRQSQLSQLKSRLLKDVSYLCRRADRLWSQPIVKTLREIRGPDMQAVFFGGTLRSLLISRLYEKRLGRPRDVDIVVAGTSIEALRERFREIIARETRFGGLHLSRMNWHFDLWPLHRTWAFVKDNRLEPDFSALPSTTFFNLESIAVDVWPTPGCSRNIYSGDDQFFDGILSKTLEINREENPFPSLCVVRSLLMAAGIDFAIGPRLVRYIASHGGGIALDELEEIQRKHYGAIRQVGLTLQEWIKRIIEFHVKNPDTSFRLPLHRQQTLWPEEEAIPCVHVNVMGSLEAANQI